MSELKQLYDDLNKIVWLGADPGWDLAIEAVRKEIAKRLDVHRTQPEATKPAQDLSAAILALPLPEPKIHDDPVWHIEYFTKTQMLGLLKAAAALASPADALVAVDRETSTSDSENCSHLTDCPGCDKCEALLEHYMACDECGSWGNKEANGWTKASGNQFVCESCAAIQAQKDGHAE